MPPWALLAVGAAGAAAASAAAGPESGHAHHKHMGAPVLAAAAAGSRNRAVPQSPLAQAEVETCVPRGPPAGGTSVEITGERHTLRRRRGRPASSLAPSATSGDVSDEQESDEARTTISWPAAPLPAASLGTGGAVFGVVPGLDSATSPGDASIDLLSAMCLTGFSGSQGAKEPAARRACFWIRPLNY